MSDPMKLPKLENLTDLANLLRSIDNSPESEIGFDMTLPFENRKDTAHPCGSACCIGGWVCACNKLSNMPLWAVVQTLTPDTDSDECNDLCWPDVGFPAWHATPEQAARAVEILRDTGKCDWAAAMGDQS